MPIATPEVYAEMLDAAKKGSFAYPAINVSSSQTLNAALQGFAEAGSDGIVQVSTGGAEYASGPDDQEHGRRRGRAGGVRARGGQELPDQHRAAHRPLPEGQAGRLRPAAARDVDRAGQGGRAAAVPVAHVGRVGGAGGGEPVDRRELLALTSAANIILEIEVGVVGGEEDGVSHEINEKLYTTVEDGLRTVEVLGTGEKGRYITALTFGNVHGVYKPGAVKLRPEVLKDIQEQVGAKIGKERPFDLVFHGGSGSTLEEIRAAVGLRRGQDEHRHRHPVRVHPAGRRAHVHQLRRRAEGRRRGRKQEGVRPAGLGQAGRGRHEQARGRGLRGPALSWYVPEQVVVRALSLSSCAPGLSSCALSLSKGTAVRRRPT